MADIASNLTFARWLTAKAEPYMDFSDDFLFSTMVARGISDDATLLSDTTEKQRDLCLADVYFAAATSSVKTGTQGESDGGWTHYVSIKNAINRAGLLDMAKTLYKKWDEPFLDPTNKITLKPLY
jgi:hypothetical protein